MIIVSKRKLSEMNNNSTEKNIIQEAEGEKTFEVQYTVKFTDKVSAKSASEAQQKIRDKYKDQSVIITSTKEVEDDADDLMEGAYGSSFSDLKKALKRFDENGKIAKQGDWKIAKGGYDKNFEVYYKEDPIVGGFVGDSGTEVRVYDRENDLANKASEIVCSVYKDCYKSINEDLAQDVAMDDTVDEISSDNRGFAGVINDLIIDEYDAINGYNGAIETAKVMGLETASKLLQDISDEETRHIGELQELMKTVTPQANEIENGGREAAEKIADFSEGVDDSVDGAISANSPLWNQTNAIVLDNVDDDIMGIESYL